MADQHISSSAGAGIVQTLFGLTGKVAVITGSAAGIGSEMARLFAAAGASVVIADLNADGAAAIAKEVEAAGGTAIAVPCNTTDEASISALFDTVEQRFGGVDILVNNAGIFPVKALLDLTAADFTKVQDINVKGYFLCMQRAIAGMKQRGQGGRIINISSIASVHPVLKGYAAYGASKGAVNAMTRAIALEVAEYGVTVNALLIGGVVMKNRPTMSDGARAPVTGPATQPGRFLLGPATAEKHAGVALFLASDAASHMTGELIVADCGFLLT